MVNVVLLFARGPKETLNETGTCEGENTTWRAIPGTKSYTGNFCLHFKGHPFRFIGTKLGNTGYTLTMELEFSEMNVPKNYVA